MYLYFNLEKFIKPTQNRVCYPPQYVIMYELLHKFSLVCVLMCFLVVDPKKYFILNWKVDLNNLFFVIFCFVFDRSALQNKEMGFWQCFNLKKRLFILMCWILISSIPFIFLLNHSFKSFVLPWPLFTVFTSFWRWASRHNWNSWCLIESEQPHLGGYLLSYTFKCNILV